MKMKMNELDWAAWVFVIIGALSWGVLGAFKLDLVTMVFGTSPTLTQLVYILIGLSGLYWLYRMITMKK